MFILRRINIKKSFLYIEINAPSYMPVLDICSDIWFMKLHTRIMTKPTNQTQVRMEIHFQVVISFLYTDW